MKLVIDATNIKTGGGFTHLREILSFDFAVEFGFEQVIVFAPDQTLEKLPSKYWLKKENHNWINRNYFYLFLWKLFIFKKFVQNNNYLVFIPGTGYSFTPYVTMCRNLLPLEYKEINRFFPAKEWLRLIALRFLHIFSYKNAHSIIFLNTYCKDVVEKLTKFKNFSIIPHGINKTKFITKSKSQILKYDKIRPIKLIYVSTINLYKHQWLIAQAVDELNKEGFFVELTIIGDKETKAHKLLTKTLSKLQFPNFIKYLGSVKHDDLISFYNTSDVFIFPSTCETFGMVILEAMSCGLPILCSKYSSMPSTFENVPIYFDPYNIESIKSNILLLYQNLELTQSLSEKSVFFSDKFSWENTSKETFEYLSTVSKFLKY